jgi:hypothetical protein
MTPVEQMIDEFNEELKVAIEIGNEDKIRIIKHLITIATSYLPKEKELRIEFAKMHVKIALKAVENEMILQASSVKHWYLPQNIK